MSDARDLLGRDFWSGVLDDVRGEADDWVAANRDDLESIARDEAAAIFAALRRGDTQAAKIEMARRMTPEQWAAYRDGTTAQLAGAADRRARIMKALEDLGQRAAKRIGAAVIGALGI